PANDAAAAPEVAPPKRESAKSAAFELQPLGSAPAASGAASQARPAGAATAQAVFQAKAAAPKETAGRNMTMLWVIGGVIVAAPPSAPAPATLTTLPSRAAPASRAPDIAAELVRDPPAAPSLKLAPTEKPRVPTEIAVGYDALRSGDLPAARRSYAAALAADPASLDGHLGLATIEARLGNVAVAASHYRRALELDPRNATALAGLASIAELSQPEMLEGQLRADIARYPQSAALHFALGNLYASRGRWEDAQMTFFEALRLEPASA